MVRNKRQLTFRQLIYNFRYRCGEYVLRGFIGGLPYMPERLVTAFVFLWKYRKRMEESVATVLGKEIPDRARQKDLVRRAWLNFARGVLDTTTVMHFSKEKIISTVKLEGEEHIRCALEQGRGVLALSAHLGSF